MIRSLFIFFVALVAFTSSTRAALAPAAPGVNFEQRLGEKLPLDLGFHDETGQPVRLRNYFGNKPVVLLFGYSRCPQLCSVIANGMVETLRNVRSSVSKDYSVVYVSIDPTDTARDLAALKRRDVGRYGRTGAGRGWHCLSGEGPAIQRLTNAAGFHYTFDPRQKLYAHASGFIVATPDGRISRYFLGVDFGTKDVAKALARAAEGKTGDSVFNLLLVCARGLGVTGRYGRIIWATLEVSVTITVIVVFGGIGWMLREERRRKVPSREAAS